MCFVSNMTFFCCLFFYRGFWLRYKNKTFSAKKKIFLRDEKRKNFSRVFLLFVFPDDRFHILLSYLFRRKKKYVKKICFAAVVYIIRDSFEALISLFILRLQKGCICKIGEKLKNEEKKKIQLYFKSYI